MGEGEARFFSCSTSFLEFRFEDPRCEDSVGRSLLVRVFEFLLKSFVMFEETIGTRKKRYERIGSSLKEYGFIFTLMRILFSKLNFY